MARKFSATQLVRRITLGFFLAGLTAMTFLHQKLQGVPAIDALDPFGGLETLMKFLAGGEFIKKIEPGNIVLLGGVVALGLLLTRFFCGWFCAFGALQGVFGWIGAKLFRRRFVIPKKVDRVLRLVKYPLFILIIAKTWSAGDLVIRSKDPLAAFAHIWVGPKELLAEFAVGTVVLLLILAASALIDRAFCKYLCPLGVLNALLSRVPLFRIRRVESTCVSCSACDRVCPMNVDVSIAGTVGSPECIACMECVTACPTKKDTLELNLAGRKISPRLAVILGFAIFLLAAAIGQASGMLRFTAPSLRELSSRGTLNVADIKGSSTYESVAEAYGVDLDRLYRELGVDRAAVPPNARVKDTGSLSGIEDFETDAVRFAVAKILGVPYAGESGSSGGDGAGVAQSSSVALTVPEDFELEGTMTIADVAEFLGSTTGAVVAKLGLPLEIPVDRPLRDMREEYGYSMPTLKEKIHE